jgi:hypothetical protein
VSIRLGGDEILEVKDGKNRQRHFPRPPGGMATPPADVGLFFVTLSAVFILSDVIGAIIWHRNNQVSLARRRIIFFGVSDSNCNFYESIFDRLSPFSNSIRPPAINIRGRWIREDSH